MIQTPRLTIRMASDDEMRIMMESEKDPEMIKAYGEMLSFSAASPELRQWYAAWLIELPDGKRIGDLCFKGLDPAGMAEIGYGLLPEYWGKGYATEAVRAMVQWASEQPNVKRIEAETEENNAASQRVLQKVGFVPLNKNGEEGPRFIWQGKFL